MSGASASTHARTARRSLIAIVVASLLGLLAAKMQADHRPAFVPGPTGLRFVAQTVSGNGACDVTGVSVTFNTQYRKTPGPGYYVPSVGVHHITWPSCSGATLAVQLTNGSSQVIGSGSVPAAGPDTTVPLTPQPDARLVTGVNVTLTGGTTPVPPECSSMTFTNVRVGTTGNDVIQGTNQNDLIYSLTGNDQINGLQGNDCLNGGPGPGDVTTITDGNGNGVILSGNGRNTVVVGNGTDLIKLGNGDGNSIVAGNGAVTVFVGTGTGNSIKVGNGPDIIYTGGRTSNSAPPSAGTTTIKVGTGAIKIYGGSGDDTIYLSTGSGTVDGGGGTNVCHVPSLKNMYTITRCKVVSP